jgi:hypothetical protein
MPGPRPSWVLVCRRFHTAYFPASDDVPSAQKTRRSPKKSVTLGRDRWRMTSCTSRRSGPTGLLKKDGQTVATPAPKIAHFRTSGSIYYRSENAPIHQTAGRPQSGNRCGCRLSRQPRRNSRPADPATRNHLFPAGAPAGERNGCSNRIPSPAKL